MSLQVWLPLDGDLHNQGVSNLQFSYSGTNFSIDSDGKIGNCYKRTARAADAIISDKTINLGSYQSMFCWIKMDAFNSSSNLTGILGQHRHPTNTGMGITLKYKSATTGQLSVNTGTGSARTYVTYLGSTTLTTNTWYHVGYTYDGAIIKLYVNGIEDGSYAFSGMSCPSEYIQIGNWAFNSSTLTTTTIANYCALGSINDVRIYDHCLSAAEVHEIAQGLVLHYKLDNNGHDNLFKTDPTLTATVAATGTSNYTSFVYIDDNIKDNGVFKEGTPYTIEYDYVVNSVNGANAYFYTQLNGARSAPAITQTMIRTAGATGHVIENFKVTSGQADYDATFRVRWRINGAAGGESITISNVRMYLGTSDEINYVSDSSGYGHNGTIVGNIQNMSSSSRYSSCIYIPSGDTDYIVTNETVGNPTDAITMNIWAKTSAAPVGTDYHSFFNIATDTQPFEFAIYKTGYFRQGIKVNGTRYVKNSSVLNLIDGQWHMYTMTYDGENIYRYVDGILRTEMTQTVSGTITGANCKFLIGHYGSNTTYRSTQAYFSDARVYATALSADDILSLYHTSAKVDNKQNFHTFELVENSSGIKINKCGQTLCSELEENTVTKFYKTNQIIKTNGIIEL